MSNDNTTVLVAYPETLRSIAKDLREKGLKYRVEKLDFKNYNSAWKGYRGLGLRVTIDDYNKLYP